MARELTILFTPGHAVHHISAMDSLTSGLSCGEALGYPSRSIPKMVFPAGMPPFDPETYLRTIEKLEDLAPSILFYSHFGTQRDSGNHVIRAAKEVASDFDRIVGDAVAAGANDVQVMERIKEYVKQKQPESDLPAVFDFDSPGHIDYHRRRRQK